MKAIAGEVEQAKEFPLARLQEQADREATRLWEIEKRMFLFSESSGEQPDFEASTEFDEKYDGDGYEARIAKLLRHAYHQDKHTSGGRASWENALNSLRDEDFYGLVMVDQAGIPRARPKLTLSSFGFSLGFILLSLAGVAALAVATLLIFQPSRLHLFLPDWVRLLLFFVFIAVALLIARLPRFRNM